MVLGQPFTTYPTATAHPSTHRTCNAPCLRSGLASCCLQGFEAPLYLCSGDTLGEHCSTATDVLPYPCGRVNVRSCTLPAHKHCTLVARNHNYFSSSTRGGSRKQTCASTSCISVIAANSIAKSRMPSTRTVPRQLHRSRIRSRKVYTQVYFSLFNRSFCLALYTSNPFPVSVNYAVDTDALIHIA